LIHPVANIAAGSESTEGAIAKALLAVARQHSNHAAYEILRLVTREIAPTMISSAIENPAG
jgi:hypothetical protein